MWSALLHQDFCGLNEVAQDGGLLPFYLGLDVHFMLPNEPCAMALSCMAACPWNKSGDRPTQEPRKRLQNV